MWELLHGICTTSLLKIKIFILYTLGNLPDIKVTYDDVLFFKINISNLLNNYTLHTSIQLCYFFKTLLKRLQEDTIIADLEWNSH
jgi:hypothetical protein